MVTAESIKGYLTPTQAASRCGVSPQTIGNWYRSGKLAGCETAHGLLVSPADVERKRQEKQEQRAERVEAGQ